MPCHSRKRSFAMLNKLSNSFLPITLFVAALAMAAGSYAQKDDPEQLSLVICEAYEGLAVGRIEVKGDVKVIWNPETAKHVEVPSDCRVKPLKSKLF
jgi:hypothetical protein